jgi:hypothetical protein
MRPSYNRAVGGQPSLFWSKRESATSIVSHIFGTGLQWAAHRAPLCHRMRQSFVKLIGWLAGVKSDETPRGAGRGIPLRAALRAAHSAESDEDARSRLSHELGGSKRDIHHALNILAAKRDQFDMDRAYRLLHAAITSDPVESIRSDLRELFSQEEQLGRIPLAQAFAFLAERQPGLSHLHAAAAQPVSALLGPAARNCSDPLLRSQLALSVVSQHLAIQSGSQEGDISCSYFSAPRKTITLSSGFSVR